MLKLEFEKFYKSLLDEAEGIFLPESLRRENQSIYLIDYLYGVSDIHKEVEKILEENFPKEEWKLFYRCLINIEILKKDGFDKIKKFEPNLFLMRDETDLENWENHIRKISKKDSNIISEEADKKVNEILAALLEYKGFTEIDKLFKSEEAKNSVLKLLRKYCAATGEENQMNAVAELDNYLKNEKKQLAFNKTGFYENVLYKLEKRFTLNNSYISKAQKNYKEEI